MSRDFSLVAWGTEGPVEVDLYDDQGNLHQKDEFPQVHRDDSALPSAEKEIDGDPDNVDDSDDGDDSQDDGDNSQDDGDDSQDDGDDSQDDGDDSDDDNAAAV
jgi:hypothetical protein